MHVSCFAVKFDQFSEYIETELMNTYIFIIAEISSIYCKMTYWRCELDDANIILESS